jgi:hypothetical protein
MTIMRDSHKDRRLDDGPGLIKSFESLNRVKPEERSGFVHDLLMSHIDGICEKHKANGRSPFTNGQLLIIRDISWAIVAVLDKKSQPPKGFFRRSWREFGALNIAMKITTVVGVIAIMSFLYGAATFAYSYAMGLRATPPAAKMPAKQPKNGAANTPSNPG